MACRNLMLVAIVAISSLLLLDEAASFSTNHNINTFIQHGRNNGNLHDILGNSSKVWQQEWLVKAATPSYLQDFFKLADKAYNKRLTFEPNRHNDFQDFLNDLLNGVESDSCKGHVAEWFWRWQDFKRLLGEEDKWVLQMIDSWGKIPEGILSGHVNSYGDFHECVQIEVADLEILNDMYPKENIQKSFEGQYCTSHILTYAAAMEATPHPPVGDDAARNEFKRVSNGIQESVSVEEFLKTLFGQVPSSIMMIPSVSVCLPSSCSLPDVQQILVNGLHKLYIPPLDPKMLPWPVTSSCIVGNKPKMDAPVIVIIVLIAALLALALGAGVLDYWYSSAKDKTSPPSTIAYKYLMAFSLYTNIKKWLSTRRSPEDLGCLHGIRFFSTCWVLLAHSFGAFMKGPQWNMIDIKNVPKGWAILAISNGTFSVDTFFVMSGMLATYSILKMLDKSKGKFNVIMFYVHRYIRLTPTYAILVGITATLLNYAGNGPNWGLQGAEENCRKNWWTNILYINNLVNTKEPCNSESWYLANDMQFYILSPLIVYPIWKWEKVGMGLLTVYTILSCISQTLVVRFAKGAPAAMIATGDLTNAESVDEIYIRPWTRISPFLIGIWVGWILHKTRGKQVNIARPFIAVLWLCSTGIALSILFAVQPWFDPANQIPKVAGYFYGGLSRACWGVVIAWVIFACVKGYGGIVNKFLSWSVFMPLGRLCFCVYLVSVHLQDVFHIRLAVPIKWDTYTAVNIYFAHIVMSYIAGFICTLIFESPFITLQKLIFEGSGVRKEIKKPNDSSDLSTKNVEVDIVNNNSPEKSTKINTA